MLLMLLLQESFAGIQRQAKTAADRGELELFPAMFCNVTPDEVDTWSVESPHLSPYLWGTF
jgi:hypothetical protein